MMQAPRRADPWRKAGEKRGLAAIEAARAALHASAQGTRIRAGKRLPGPVAMLSLWQRIG